MDEAIKEQDQVLPLSPTLFAAFSAQLAGPQLLELSCFFLPSYLMITGITDMCCHTEIYMVSYHCSIAVKTYHDSVLKIIVWRFAHSFRGLVHHYYVREHGSMRQELEQ